MRKIKKIQRRLAAFKEKCSEFFQAQVFYFKQAVKQFLWTFFRLTWSMVQIVVFAVIFAFITVFAEKIHEKYVEHKVSSNVLFIKSAPDAPKQGSATGFEVKTKSGKVYTLTNAHVCALKNANNVILIEEKRYSGRFIPKHVLEIYEDNDLCIVEGLAGYEGLSLGEESEISDTVFTIGYPLAQGLHIAKGRVKGFGKVEIQANEIPLDQCSGERLRIKKFNLFFIFEITVCMRSYRAVNTDLIVYPGASGSPMVDSWGKVVGVIFATDMTAHWGRAVPLRDVNKLLAAY